MIIVRKALVRDINGIFELTNTNASKGLMLPRSKYKIVQMLHSFFVAVESDDDNGKVLGSAALTPLWTDMAEIMSLSVDASLRKQGIGRLLVETCLNKAREMGFPKVIALTYQVDFFKRMGFSVTDKDQFPRKLWRECLECPKLEHCDETAMYIDLV